MIGRDPAIRLVGAMSSLLRATRAAAHRNSQLMGASGTPLGVLKALQAGATRPSDLATVLHIGPSVVSRALLPLEQEGLVARTPDPADARATLIGLTDLGRDRLAALQQVYVDQVREVLAEWSDSEVEQAAGILHRLEHAIATSPDPGPRSPLLGPTRPLLDVDEDADPATTRAADAALPTAR